MMNRKRMLSLVLTIAMVLSMGVGALGNALVQFTDTENHWSKEEIDYMTSEGVINGYDDGTFKPDNNMTIAEFLKVINHLMGYEKKAEEVKFEDVKETDWFYEEVAKALAAGLIDESEILNPNELITREQVARIIGIAFNLEKDARPAKDFSDNSKISLAARGYVGTLKGKGYILGYPDGTFGPKRNITRAEVVKMLFNIVEVEGLPEIEEPEKEKPDTPVIPYIPYIPVRVPVGEMAKAVVTGEFENREELNNAIDAMWTVAYDTGVFDATKVTQDYVDKMAAALSKSQLLRDVAVPVELVVPGGKIFESAQIKHDVDNILSATDAVKIEANFGGKLIAWMNTNMAYGWLQDDGKVVYTYVVKWTDGTETEYAITFMDADTGAMVKAVVTGEFENREELNNAIDAMWTAAYDTGVFDATKVTQDYVDKMAAALSKSQSLRDVAVPVELVVPEGKTFESAQIKHDVDNILSATGAVKIEINFGGKLIAWMNTNMAYGWTQDDDEVVYTYVVKWTDGTETEYAITFMDADIGVSFSFTLA